MKKSAGAVIAIVAGAVLALSAALPASAITINTGSAKCKSSAYWDKSTSRGQYSVENVVDSNLHGGTLGKTYSNGATATTRVTNWNNSGGVVHVWDAYASRANGLYLISASITCVK